MKERERGKRSCAIEARDGKVERKLLDIATQAVRVHCTFHKGAAALEAYCCSL